MSILSTKGIGEYIGGAIKKMFEETKSSLEHDLTLTFDEFFIKHTKNHRLLKNNKCYTFKNPSKLKYWFNWRRGHEPNLKNVSVKDWLKFRWSMDDKGYDPNNFNGNSPVRFRLEDRSKGLLSEYVEEKIYEMFHDLLNDLRELAKKDYPCMPRAHFIGKASDAVLRGWEEERLRDKINKAE